MSSATAIESAGRLVQALPEPTMLLTSVGRIVVANRQACDLLRLDSERASAQCLTELVDDPEGRLAGMLRGWSRSREVLPGAFSVVGPAGRVTYSCAGSLVFPASESSGGVILLRFWPRAQGNPFILLNQKITQLNDEVVRRRQAEEALRESEAALRERALEAEALNRAKDEFLATVSHELRTPLNAMLGWASLLRSRASEPAVIKAVDVIHRNAQAQAQIIEDILDVSRIISGKLRLVLSQVDLVAIARDALDVVRASAMAKCIDLILTSSDEVCQCAGDAERLQQVLWNLLSNAVKFTQPGGRVHVDIGRTDTQLSVTVSDTGRGIARDFLPFVFERFRQADGSTTRRSGGLGLGLALARHIVELHGGEVHAASGGPGAGSTFTVSLPVRALARSESASGSRPPPRPACSTAAVGERALAGVPVLVVDDEPDARDLLETALAEAGALVHTAGSAAQALELLPRCRPRLLVSDIGMSDVDGYALMARVRERPEGRGIPSLALTAYTRVEDREKALAAGFTAHVGKPIEPVALVALLRTLLDARSS